MQTNERKGFEFDEVPELPEYKEWELREHELTLREFKASKNRLMIYETKEGEVKVLIDQITPQLFACIVAKLCYPTYEKLFEFLKLVCESVRLIKKQTKLDNDRVGVVEKYIKSKINFKPSNN
jgi:hypothetical protein